MDITEYIPTLTERKRPKPVKRFLHFLFPVSVFSLLLLCHPSCPPCYPSFIKLLSITSLANGLNHLMPDKAMILFFNVILILFANSLGPSEFPDTVCDEFIEKEDHQNWLSESIEVEAQVEDMEVTVESVIPQKKTVESIRPLAGNERACVDELELLDIDELNKRFEEFIKREKRKRRLESFAAGYSLTDASDCWYRKESSSACFV